MSRRLGARAKKTNIALAQHKATLYSQDSHSRQHGVCVLRVVVVVWVNRETVRVVATRGCVARFAFARFVASFFVFLLALRCCQERCWRVQKRRGVAIRLRFWIFSDLHSVVVVGDVECVCVAD